jgi:hypothetical protein
MSVKALFRSKSITPTLFPDFQKRRFIGDRSSPETHIEFFIEGNHPFIHRIDIDEIDPP